MEKKTKKIIGTAIAIVMVVMMAVIPSAMGETAIDSNLETIGTDNPTNTTQKDLLTQQKLKKAKKTYIKKAKKSYKSLKSYMPNAQKKSYKIKIIKIKKAKKIQTVKIKYNKIVKIFKKAKAYKKEHSYSGKVGVSCYGPYEGECVTATGRTITNGTYYVAVPVGKVTSYSSWKHMSQSNKRKYFYYHEKIYLKNGSRTCVAHVEDCGGFQYMKSYGYYRLFDLTPAVFHKLGISGIGTVRWHY